MCFSAFGADPFPPGAPTALVLLARVRQNPLAHKRSRALEKVTSRGRPAPLAGGAAAHSVASWPGTRIDGSMLPAGPPPPRDADSSHADPSAEMLGPTSRRLPSTVPRTPPQRPAMVDMTVYYISSAEQLTSPTS